MIARERAGWGTFVAGLALAAVAWADSGDELVGDWERSLGATRIREVWHISRNRSQFAVRGEYYQNDQKVGSFRGDGESFEPATATLKFRLTGSLAGKEIDRQIVHELVVRGARLSLTSTLGKKKETAALIKARPSATGSATAAGGAKVFVPTPQTPAFTEVRRFKIGPINYFHSAALSPDGKLLALCDRSAEGRGVEIHDVDAGMVVKRLPTGGLVVFMGFTDDGQTFVASGFDLSKPSLATAWDTATWTEKWKLDHGRMTNHALSGDGRYYAAGKGNVPGGPSGALKIWDTTTQQEVHSQEYAHSPRLAMPADGKILFFGHGNPAIFEWPKKKLLATEAGRGGDDGIANNVMSFTVTADGRGYALGGYTGDAAILVTSSGKLVRSLPQLSAGEGPVKDLRFIDNRRLLVARAGAEFGLFDTTSGRVLAYARPELATRSVANIDTHPGSTRFAAYCGAEAIVFELPAAASP
jgi:WD40 repeat protein